MDKTRKRCIILTPADLSPENINTTVRTIEHNPNYFYLLEAGWKTNLWEVVEKLGKISDDENILTRMRIAYDLKFDLQTELKTGDDISIAGTEVKSFVDLLELLDFDENLNLNCADYHVIIDDDDIEFSEGDDEASRAVAALFQQTVFLNIVGLDIQKKSEIKKSLMKDRFRANYADLREEILDNKAFIETRLSNDTNLSAESVERAKKILTAFNAMLAEFDKARARPIRIAAMGTKKAGKSVIINSLIKRDYAPTSLTIPTPNTIKYVPAPPDSRLKLEYDGDIYTFDSAESLKKFIGDEFSKAMTETGEGSGLPNMTIYYPCDDLNGYEVWDTPGPNVAFTDEHAKNAEECIEAVDVCIFVMNYSNHLTNDEINFLQKIHQIFKEKNKFYSLFITVNRIDERYNDQQEKSVDRIIDYIRQRLAALPTPYKNITIFGTSALQNFYLDDLVGLVKADRAQDSEDVDELPIVDTGAINPLRNRHRNALTQIKFIKGALDNLDFFHSIENPTERELYALSGMPQLWSYTKYIGEKKADLEIVDKVVGSCETQFDIIKNSLLIADLLELTDQDKIYLVELGKLIENLAHEVEKAIDEIQPLMNEDKLGAACYRVSREVKNIHKQARKAAFDRIQNILDDSGLEAGDVESMANHDEETERVQKIKSDVLDMVSGMNKQSVIYLNASKKVICDEQISIVEDGIQSAQKKIKRMTDEVKAKVTNSTARTIMDNFQIPEFPSGIDRLMAEVRQINPDMADKFLSVAAKNSGRTVTEERTRIEERDKVITGTRTEQRRRSSRGFWEGICSFFGKKYYEEVEVPYTKTIKEPFEVTYYVTNEVYDVEKFKDELARELQKRISSAIDDAHETMENAIKIEIENIFTDVKRQCTEIGDSYTQLYNDFAEDINLASDETSRHREALERDIGSFNEIKAKLQSFFGMWDDILHGEAKR